MTATAKTATGTHIDTDIVTGFDLSAPGVLSFIDGNVPFGGNAGEFRFVTQLFQTLIEVDLNGGKKADFSIAVDGNHTFIASDFNF